MENINQLDVKKICRTCMKEGDMTDLYYNCDKDLCLIQKLMHCTFVQVTPGDGLPSQICLNCLAQINLAYTFARNCEKVDKLLRNVFHKENNVVATNTEQNEVDNSVTHETIETNNDDNSNENFEINFDPSIYTDHTYDKKSSELIFKPKSSEEETKDSQENKTIKTETIEKQLTVKSGPPYTCKRCDKQFPVYHQLKEHYKISKHCRNDYSHRACPICSKVVSYSHLNHHLRVHTKEKPFCCEFCGKRFSLSGNLVRHRRVHTGDKPFQCDICQKRFTQSTRMKDHRRLHTGEKAYVCNVCGKTFSQFANFRHHMKKHEKDEADEQNGANSIDSDGTAKHNKTVNLNLKCEVCSQIFRSVRSLKTHSMTHEEKKYSCSDCGRGFTDMSRLQNHYKTHSAERPFSCHICAKGFTLKSSLKSHLFIHSGEKPYPCSYCEKAFVQLGQLKYHLRIHTGERPYPCSVCGKKFALNGNLTVHMRTHTGETPYICSVCNKGFYDRSSMKKHQKAHVSDLTL